MRSPPWTTALTPAAAPSVVYLDGGGRLELPARPQLMGRLAVADGIRSAEWLQRGVRGFAESVLSLVPAGFPAYVRVFHPAFLAGAPVGWAEIAAATGKRAHPGMQLPALTGDDQTEHALPGLFDRAPEVGSLPAAIAPEIVALIGRHTATPERCWFAPWVGWAALEDDVRRAPTFALPNREYHLLHGPLEAVLDVELPACRYRQLPSLWWPDDRAWCLATEIDLNTTYVGCSRGCAEALVASSRLEAATIAPATGVTFDSDTLNRQ